MKIIIPCNRIFYPLILFSLLILGCTNKKEEESKLILEQIAEQTNIQGNLPAQIDQYTIAEKVEFNSENNIITYNFSLLTEEVTVEEWRENLKEIELEQIQNAKDLQGDNVHYKALNVIIESIYRDRAGNEIYSFRIQPEQYLK